MDVTRVSWRTSSYSGNSGTQCVEVGAATGTVGVLARDTKDRSGAVLWFTFAEWRAFTAEVRTGDFDPRESVHLR